MSCQGSSASLGSTSSLSPMTTTPAASLRRVARGVVDACGPIATIRPATARTASKRARGTRSSGGAQRQNR